MRSVGLLNFNGETRVAKDKSQQDKNGKAKKDRSAFVVLTKGNRTLVVQQPTKKQMKRYKKKDWVSAGTVNNGGSDEFRAKLAEVVGAANGH